MWAKLDDALIDHHKTMEAGRAFTRDRRGPDGRVYALGLFSVFLIYANKHLTDGFISQAVLEELRFVTRPLDAARIMVTAGFLEAVEGGYRIHDFHDHNPMADDIREKRKADRERKRQGQVNGRRARNLRGVAKES